MRITVHMQKALNEQIAKEFGASYLYLSMAAYFAEKNFNGFANWMRMQASEETNHALKLFQFVEDRGGRVTLEGIDRPPPDFPSPIAVFEHARDHETKVSAGINQLFELAATDKDWATQATLQWFITEQVEEEKTSSEIVATLRMIGDNASGLYMFDKELGRRGSSD
ncbi:MAG: ferritin [Gemmatimonadetes bacterium]|nr:ferritin [Gemmatimonadota bacterium]